MIEFLRRQRRLVAQSEGDMGEKMVVTHVWAKKKIILAKVIDFGSVGYGESSVPTGVMIDIGGLAILAV